VIRLQLDEWGLISRRDKGFFSSPKCPDWLWGPHCFLFCGYWEGVLSPGVDMKLTTHLHLVPRLRMGGAKPLLHLYVLVTWTVTTLSLLLLYQKSTFRIEVTDYYVN